MGVTQHQCGKRLAQSLYMYLLCEPCVWDGSVHGHLVTVDHVETVLTDLVISLCLFSQRCSHRLSALP